jgi:DNA invertase Pin-like site-specific DNA recombinase
VSTRDWNCSSTRSTRQDASESSPINLINGAQLERLGLSEALSHLPEADTLVVWKLDRLGRSVKGLVDLVNELEARKVHFQSVTDGVDTKTPAGGSFFT